MRRKVPLNWTKETLAECARVHMDQICDRHYNYSGEYREKEITRIIEHYFKIECAIDRGDKFILAEDK
jgi:hypothetical protein